VQKVYRTVLFASCDAIPLVAEDTNAVYFQRTTTGPVSLPSSIDEANEVMPKLFEFGSLNENATLLTLDQVLQNVYLPILSYSGTRSEQGTDSTTTAEETPRRGSMGESSKGRVVIRDEFLINLQKFANHIGRTMQQLAGDIRLIMPDLVLTDDISELARNPEIVPSLEQTLHDWEVTMASALEQQLNHTPQGNGTLAEMDFWRERNATLSALVEQLKRPLVEKVIAILSQTSSDSLSTFEYHKNELTKYYVEAKDNVRFLLTLERHFKNLAHGANFKVILETIPSLMNALRMVWIISRHYNRDERMVPLMERIAWELAERVAKVVNIRTILK
jgi:dynein heavy chain